ncbi:hypothetical protein OSTOST_05205 [Ostertagia ostertagi]
MAIRYAEPTSEQTPINARSANGRGRWRDFYSSLRCPVDIAVACMTAVCGTPSPANWPDVEKMPLFNTLRSKKQYVRCLREEFAQVVPSGAIDLMDKMLLLDPKRRISAKDAISHFWIKNFDYSTVPPLRLPQHQDCHELWSKKQRKERRSNNPRSQQFEGQELELSACPPPPTAALQYDRRRNSPSNGYVNQSSINPSRTEAVEQAISAVLQTSDTTQLVRLLQYTSEADDVAILNRLSQSAQFVLPPGDSRPIKERLLDVLSNRAHIGRGSSSINFVPGHPGNVLQQMPTTANPIENSSVYRGVTHHPQPPPYR